MPGNHLVFDAFSASEIAPDQYDPNIYAYRYRNGVRAESISGFADVKRRLEHLLMEKPYTTEQLSRELSFDRPLLQKILDYLFTHTGEIAALDIPHQSTLYIWANREVAENIRTKFGLGAVGVDTDDYTAEDITAIASYLTNLLVLHPSIELLDDAIDKCRMMLDAARLSQAFQPSAELENRISLLKKKYGELCERREAEMAKWAREETDDDQPAEADASIDLLPDPGQAGKLYPYSTLYLLGSGQNYSGPEMLKHISVDDPELSTMSFANLSLLVVELDTFTEDLETGRSVLGLVETYLSSFFPGKGLTVKFRRITGVRHKRHVERLLHEEVLRIRKRGYHVVT
ncbi:MAG: hypothetical protein JW852_00135 [Spirochaetales bacterium]|nr:hypothetical protein [Spirochaetales bacterium]